MKVINVYFKAVSNPLERGYLSYQFIHPIHGKKVLGCFRKDNEKNRAEFQLMFARNCGHSTVDNFNFIEGDKP
jgi:hypothetical protein